ncbi:hypothetical protein [Aliifodinibius sp. S!AR15-10]|uniref:hypothetical protein n=1 Tax=Aliifodinibius sp. S!AR15-10 TaxID=2950437 RepID=UPI00286FE1EA|nr:hypothetical protein [Aliifodinibius sp. S!AR15-10]
MFTRILLTAVFLFIIGTSISVGQPSATKKNVIKTIEGNTAWVSTLTHTRGTYNDRKLDLNSLELAVLKKEGSWEINALHWSSRSRK